MTLKFNRLFDPNMFLWRRKSETVMAAQSEKYMWRVCISEVLRDAFPALRFSSACLVFTHPGYHNNRCFTLKRTRTLHNLTPPSVRLMRRSYVISLNVVEKFWTPTQRHSYETVDSNHAVRLANRRPAGSYL